MYISVVRLLMLRQQQKTWACIHAVPMMSRLILGGRSLWAPDHFLRRENNGGYRFICVPATFVDDEPEAVHVELPMMPTYNDGLLAGQILEKEIRVSAQLLIIPINVLTMDTNHVAMNKLVAVYEHAPCACCFS